MTPTKFFFTKGVGVHREKLSSFEVALRDAGIAPFNLVTVSSILPPGCKRITRDKGLNYLNIFSEILKILRIYKVRR